MALSLASKTKTEVNRNRFVCYVRETTGDIASTDYDTLSNWNTYLGTFTDLGEFEDDSLKLEVEPGDGVKVSNGEEVILSHNANLEVKYLQSSISAENGILDLISKYLDVLLVSSGAGKFYNIYNIKLNGKKSTSSGGDVENWLLSNKKEVVDPDDYYTHGAIPTS